MSPIVSPTSETVQTLMNHTPPTWLKHQPVYLLPYEHFDGPYADETDAKYLGFGLAQWRHDGSDPHALSIKSWRKPDERWSRQSEEIPLHRHVDMTILLAHIMASRSVPTVELPAGTFFNQSQPIELVELVQIPEASSPSQELCRERLRKLREILNQLDI